MHPFTVFVRALWAGISTILSLALVTLPLAVLPAARLSASEPETQAHYKPGDFVVLACRADLKVENNVVDSVDEGQLLGVDRVQGDWLWVTNKNSGWLNRSSVIPARQAVEFFSAALRRAPTDARLFARRGLARALNQDFPGALKDYNEALRLKPTEAVYYGDRGCIFLALGDAERAIADFKQESSRIDTEEETKRAIRLEWLDQRLADAEALKASDTTVTLGDTP
jgi:predicted TPR repeat methyltransferase